MATNNSVLYILKYNNYYNRTIKRESTLNGYAAYRVYDPLVCNFNPADGIDTEHVFNLPYIANTPEADYAIVVNSDNEITSRWFIVNATRVRGGQYRLALHRDLIADYYDEVVNAPCFIERATANISNPFIYNSENMSFNQIKRNEKLLQDETKSGWYVGYISSNTEDTTISAPASSSVSYPETAIAFEDLSNMSGNIAREPAAYTVYIRGGVAGTTKYRQLALNTLGLSLGDSDISYTGSNPYKSSYSFNPGRTASQDGLAVRTGITSNITTVNNGLLAETKAEKPDLTFINEATMEALMNMNGGTFIDTAEGKIFKVRLDYLQEDYITETEITTGLAYETIANIAKEQCEMSLSGGNSPIVNVSFLTNMGKYNLTIIDLTTSYGLNLTIPSTAPVLTDAPYKMFAIPAESVPITDGVNTITPIADVGKNLLAGIAIKLGANLYDLQYLPYCPFRTTITNGTLNIGSLSSSNITAITKEGNNVGYVLWCKESNFSFVINESITIPEEAIDFKIAHETKFCRLVSPNYNGSFEFKPTSNMGVASFEVNCSYKPFQPYIHVNPLFNADGLYGGDFNDQRGLVCGGDFSVPLTTSNWINYQIQNASYKDAFNRQIENMETTYNINIRQQRTAGIINTITAGLSGAGAGAMMGSLGGVGMATGIGVVAGAAGAGASYWGMKKDLEYAEELQKEALSYSQDQFNYSLQNIKALPYTLGRIGAFTINNKIFPFIEFYEATPDEEKALRARITYRGMTIGAIDTIINYQQDTPSFIQGSIIRLEGIGEDYHCASAIANEIHKGVYI